MKKNIIVLSYNHPQITINCVNQSLKFNLPLILVHNGSQKNNIEYLKKTFENESLLQHFIIEKNKGYSGGFNESIKFAFNQNYVVDQCIFLTNDTLLMEIPEEEQSSQTRPMIIAPKIFARKMERVDSIIGIFTPSLGKLKHLKMINDLNINKEKFRSVQYVPGSAMVINRLAYELLDKNTVKMEEKLNTYWEDVLFSVECQRIGVQLIQDEKYQVLHKIGKTCHKDKFYTTYLFFRNRGIVSRKCTKYLWERVLFEIIFLWDLIRQLFSAFKKKDNIRFKMLLSAYIDSLQISI